MNRTHVSRINILISGGSEKKQLFQPTSDSATPTQINRSCLCKYSFPSEHHIPVNMSWYDATELQKQATLSLLASMRNRNLMVILLSLRQITSWSRGQNSYFIFGSYRVRFSARRPSIVIGVHHGSPRFHQENTGIVPQIRPRPLPSTSFPIHYSQSSYYWTLRDLRN
jgi:hypothetical protein